MDEGQVARTYPARPYLAVSVAVFREGQVLLARRARPPFEGFFSLPGGLVEAGETLASSARRELREEVAVEARIIAFNQHVEWIDFDDAGKIRHHYVIASLVGEWIAGEAKPGPEALEVVWAEPSRLAALDCTPQLVAVVEGAENLLNACLRTPSLRTGQ
ncbi:MAG TPA: NUDIX hydrolase [Methylocella sp.]|nr:NUDIX hydrolase [Methylocella sp.]